MECSKNLSKALKAYRAAMDLSLNELADETDIPKSTLCRVENEKGTTLDTLERISNALQTPVEVLLTGETPPEQLSATILLVRGIDKFFKLSAEEQKEFIGHLDGLSKLLSKCSCDNED